MNAEMIIDYVGDLIIMVGAFYVGRRDERDEHRRRTGCTAVEKKETKVVSRGGERS